MWVGFGIKPAHAQVLAEPLPSCGSRIMVPMKVSIILISDGYCYIRQKSKGEWRMQMEFRLLVSWLWDGYIILDYLGGPHVITRVLIYGKGQWRETESQTEGSMRRIWLDIACFEGAWIWPWSKNKQAASRSWKRKGREIESSLEPPERTPPCQHPDLAQRDPSGTSDFRHGKMLTLYYFKMLCFW